MSIADDELPPSLPEPSAKTQKIIDTLSEYRQEAEQNRKSGLNPRDDKWRQNLDLYWNRYDHSGKASWQSKNVMPEVPAFVDRFAAAMKDALVSTPNGFYTVTDPYDTEDDVTVSIKKMEDVWLSTIGRNQVGQLLDFSTVFEEQVKLGTLMAMSGVVLWKKDVPGGRVAFESADPRNIWLDHTYRNLYRIRRTEVDMVDVARMVSSKSSRGKPIYNLDELQRLVGSRHADKMIMEAKELSGTGQEVMSSRRPVVLDEYIASVVDEKGEIIMDNEVVIIADDQYLIRGPEKNPFMHNRDWLVYTPLVPVPLSPYGRTYMEDFGDIAKIFTDLTNLLLDATYMASMKAYAMVPSMLVQPSQAASGIYPNKIFQLQEGYTAEEFVKAIDLGSLDAGAIQMWNSLKGELSDAAGMNEIGMGQLPDKTHIAATAVAGAQQSSSAIIRSVAQTVETRWLDPMLDLVWKTGLQHAKPEDVRMAAALGGDRLYYGLVKDKRNLIKRPITFQARGISMLIQKSQKLQALLSTMQVIGQNQNLAAAFMQRVDMNKFLELLFNLSNVDLRKLEPTEREKLISSVTQPLANAAAGGQPSPAGVNAMGELTQGLGIGQ